MRRLPRWYAGLSVLVVLTAMLAGGMAGAVPAGSRALPRNVNISKASGNQSEDGIAINPLDPRQMTVVSNEEDVLGLFHGWTTDGGRTWATDVIADGDNLGTACCDPSLASDNYGNIFLTWLSASIQVKVAISTNGGASFTLIAAFDAPGTSHPSWPPRTRCG